MKRENVKTWTHKIVKTWNKRRSALLTTPDYSCTSDLCYSLLPTWLTSSRSLVLTVVCMPTDLPTCFSPAFTYSFEYWLTLLIAGRERCCFPMFGFTTDCRADQVPRTSLYLPQSTWPNICQLRSKQCVWGTFWRLFWEHSQRASRLQKMFKGEARIKTAMWQYFISSMGYFTSFAFATICQDFSSWKSFRWKSHNCFCCTSLLLAIIKEEIGVHNVIILAFPNCLLCNWPWFEKPSYRLRERYHTSSV